MQRVNSIRKKEIQMVTVEVWKAYIRKGKVPSETLRRNVSEKICRLLWHPIVDQVHGNITRTPVVSDRNSTQTSLIVLTFGRCIWLMQPSSRVWDYWFGAGLDPVLQQLSLEICFSLASFSALLCSVSASWLYIRWKRGSQNIQAHDLRKKKRCCLFESL